MEKNSPLFSFRKYPGRNDLFLTLFLVPLYIAGVSKYGYRLLIALAISIMIGFLSNI